MRILIAYSSKHGTTRNAAEILRDQLCDKADVSLVDIKKGIPSIDGFDAVVLGSSVRCGRISKQIKTFINNNLQQLNTLDCGVFLCCGFPDEFDDYVITEFKKDFTPSYGFHCFGGELKPQKISGIEKIIVKLLRNSITQHDFEDGNYKGSLPEIQPEAIRRLADKVLGK